MKIIATDNYDRDYISDKLINPSVNEEEGKKLVESLNANCGPAHPWYYKLVPDDFKLHEASLP